jgi:hypothetical protein
MGLARHLLEVLDNVKVADEDGIVFLTVFRAKTSCAVVEVIEQPRFPANLKGIQSFLGDLNYYHKFIEDCSVIVSVLYELTDEQIWSGRDLDRAESAS